MARATPAMVLACCLLSGCEGGANEHANGPGAGGSAAGGAGSSGAAAVSCETRPQASPAPLKILIRGDYERTLRSVFGAAPLDAALTTLAQLSNQKPLHAFRSMAAGTTGADVEARFQVSDLVAQTVAQSPGTLSAIASCSNQQPLAQTCVDELLTSLGLRVFRRPLEPAELTWLQGVYSEGEAIAAGDGLRFAIFALLESPHFVYRLETSGSPLPSDPNTLTLSSYEVASRLAFLVWGMAPDQALLTSAASGMLDGEAGLTSELERLLADPRARGQVSRFFEEWLEIEDLPIVNQSEAFLAGISGQGLADAMQRELSDTLLSVTLDEHGKFEDLYSSPLSVFKSPELAKLYGVTPPGQDQRAELDSQQRAGLLTRSALLLTSGESTSPIRRGAFVLRKLLCNPIPPPDPNSFPPGAIQPPSFDADSTGRQRWTAKTSQAQCLGCHGQFNAFGFALENYDTIGRFRDSEPIIDPATGTELKKLPIDASVDILLDTDPVHVTGAVELGRAFASSPRAQECLATQWLRFGAGRLELETDSCVLKDVAASMAQGSSLLDALKRVVLAPEFRVRHLEAP